MRRILGPILSFFVTTAILIRLLYFIFNEFIPSLKDNYAAIIGVSVISLLFIVFLIDYFILRFKWIRGSKYGECLSIISQGFSRIHKLQNQKNDFNKDKILLALMSVCNNLATTFAILTGTKCAVSIKLLQKTNDHKINWELFTLCRDEGSQVDRNLPDNKKYQHTINNNSDFKRLLVNQGREKGQMFISNKLPHIKKYENSSFEALGFPIKFTGNGFMDFFIHIVRLFRWPLPYKSCIIVPIIPRNVYDEAEILGFLCVDNARLFTFNVYYDKDLMRGVADGIYNLIEWISNDNDNDIDNKS